MLTTIARSVLMLLTVTLVQRVYVFGQRSTGSNPFVLACGSRLHWIGRSRGSVGCCGGRTIYNNRSGDICCGDGTVVRSTERGLTRDCCDGRRSYDPSTQVCCDGNVLPGGDQMACCGSLAYDVQHHYCLNGKVFGFNVDSCLSGRTVIVHLFDWKWSDIALECERFLGPNEFCGVQVSPPNEHRIITDPPKVRPWWERYQPVSYKLGSRSGNESQFIDMVQRCNTVGVRIYVDAVINHMCGHGSGTGIGSAGSWYDSKAMEFPGVPFGPTDFNCCQCDRCRTHSCDIENYGDSQQVRNCRLVGLLDLDLGKEYVRSKVIGYFNRLIEIGVAGFRVDAGKHMWPGDIDAIYHRLDNLNTDAGFPPGRRPFIFNEVIDLGFEQIKVGEYVTTGRNTEFRYGRDLGRAFRRHFHLANLRTFGSPATWGLQPTNLALVFIDNHDNQRGHGAGGRDVLTFYDGPTYRLATAFALAHPYGFLRIMSSHRWEGGPHSNDWIGPPHNDDWSTADVEIDPATGQCKGDWVCEHRWPLIARLVALRNVAAGSPLRHWYDNGGHQVAFGRLGRAFVAINNDPVQSLNATLHTGLPSGVYCDVATGVLADDGRSCAGRTISVNSDGTAQISIAAGVSEAGRDPIVAIHVGQRAGQLQDHTQPEGINLTTGHHRTAILIEFKSNYGEHVFILGGINHDHRPDCTRDVTTSQCALAISHRLPTSNPHYAGYGAWSVGDTHLDWYGPEPGQGHLNHRQASGSPMVWTTNEPSDAAAYHPLNRYGPHHWLLDVDMDCANTENGWFELKAYVTGRDWEPDITQDVECGGRVGGSKPYASVNHMARCGYINLFTFAAGDCTIEQFLHDA